jgi:hypothetical protein
MIEKFGASALCSPYTSPAICTISLAGAGASAPSRLCSVTDNVVPAADKRMRRLLSLGSLPPPFAWSKLSLSTFNWC